MFTLIKPFRGLRPAPGRAADAVPADVRAAEARPAADAGPQAGERGGRDRDPGVHPQEDDVEWYNEVAERSATFSMRCPVCNQRDTKVIDSRLSVDGMNIRRRRECEKCAFRFSTLEEMELLDLTVVKRDGRRVPYEREKVLRGLERSLEKRAYTESAFQKLVHRIERDVQKKRTGEITSAQLGEIVMKHLRRFDKIAYIRFASVYRQFQDIDSFLKELNELKQKFVPAGEDSRQEVKK